MTIGSSLRGADTSDGRSYLRRAQSTARWNRTPRSVANDKNGLTCDFGKWR